MTQNKALRSISELGRPMSIDLLVLPGCSLLTLASAVEPLRAANRQSGRIVFNNGYSTMNCQIRNAGKMGMGLRMERTCEIPQHIRIVVDRDQSIYNADVRWRACGIDARNHVTRLCVLWVDQNKILLHLAL